MKAAAHTRLATLAGAALVIGACADSSGVNGTGPVEVMLAKAAGPIMQIVGTGGLSFSAGGVDAAKVDSLLVEITSLSFLPTDSTDDTTSAEDDSTGTAWITLDLDQPVWLDLMALPMENDSTILIAAGKVPVGHYGMVRMLVGDAYLYFNEDITLGNAQAFLADTQYSVTVPSGSQTGLKTDASFTVVADSVGAPTGVVLVFEESATFANLTTTGSGKIMLAPVIRSQ